MADQDEADPTAASPYRAPWGRVYDGYLHAWLEAWDIYADDQETRREWRRLLDEVSR
ncbi:hypothetical protein [Micromonospora sp. MH33]|uniref:hypothetical protein n=1 Tax=Micromonospora sp. MH33 TaxID=1945509 RepID=UPI00143D8059|nr:hypothetical protein [Micromonospora sp. MH33]